MLIKCFLLIILILFLESKILSGIKEVERVTSFNALMKRRKSILIRMESPADPNNKNGGQSDCIESAA